MATVSDRSDDEHAVDDGASRRRAAARLHPGPSGSADLDRLAELACRIIKAPSGLVALIGEVSSVAGRANVPPDALSMELPLHESICVHVVYEQGAVAIADTRADARSADTTAVREGHVGSYLGAPIVADSGEVVGSLCVFGPAPRQWTAEDVQTLAELARTASSEIELAALSREFELSSARWDLAIEAAGVGSFDWDLTTGRLDWDATLIELFGYDGDERFTGTIDAFNARLHPDDVRRVSEALRRAIETVGEYEAEYRVVLPDGRTRQVQARGRALGRDGVADRLMGAAWDVSASRAEDERAARIVEAMPVGYVALRPDGTVITVNQLGERILRRGRDEVVGRELWPLLPDGPGGLLRATVDHVLATDRPDTVEIHVTGGPDVWFEARVSPEPFGTALFVSDITARQTARELAERAAEHDRAVAEALQDALLTPMRLPAGLRGAARYRTAAVGERVGGDWYDAVLRSEGPAVVVGDVVGHDITAAAMMGQLRSMLRAFLWDSDAPPSAVVQRFDHAVRALNPGALVTAVIACFDHDPDGVFTRLRWTNAGHPPPMLVRADGRVEVLEDGYDLLIGVRPDRARRDFSRPVGPGDTVLLYTDGLVETRAEGIDVGLARVAGSLRRHRAHTLPIDELLDRVVSDSFVDTPAGPTGDDVVVVALRVEGAGPTG